MRRAIVAELSCGCDKTGGPLTVGGDTPAGYAAGRSRCSNMDRGPATPVVRRPRRG
jgi:hypothetical protein